MTDENYKPLSHPWIQCDEKRVAIINEGKVFTDHSGMGFTSDEAISLGLALMETGLHLKTLQKQGEKNGK